MAVLLLNITYEPIGVIAVRRAVNLLLANKAEVVEVFGDQGAYTIKAGGSVSIVCEIFPEGRTGPITLRAEGLPKRVHSSPVTVYPGPALTRPGAAKMFGPAVVTLRADPGSAGVSGRFRVIEGQVT